MPKTLLAAAAAQNDLGALVNIIELVSAQPLPFLAAVSGIGPLDWLQAVLEPAVVGYGLRLYRNLGSHRVGWWLFASFCLLGLTHGTQLWRLGSAPVLPPEAFNFLLLLIPLLLLIGMAHTETIFVDRVRVEHQQEKLRQQSESDTQAVVAALSREKEELQAAVARQTEKTKALESAERSFRLLFTNNPQPMWVFDLHSFAFLAVNNAALAQFGIDIKETAAIKVADVLSREDTEDFMKDAAQPARNGQSRGIRRFRRKDGSCFDAEIAAIDVKYGDRPARLILATDVTERQQRESAAREEHRLQIIGQVAGSVARHFDSILGPIETEAGRLLEMPRTAELAESIDRISAAAKQGIAATRQLLLAGSRFPAEMQAVDLNLALAELEPTLRRMAGAGIAIERNTTSNLPPVMADPRLIEHILVHLVVNSCNAITGTGLITIGTSFLRFDNASPQPRDGLKPGEFVCLRIRDTGAGMGPEERARLFEPFFTTREDANHIGLGLASIYGAVRQLSGKIEVTTEPEIGTEFRVLLPVCDASVAATQAVQTSTRAAKNTARKTILVVEPDTRMRTLAHLILNWNGYRVVETDSAAVALVVWENEAPNVDLLLTEKRLPGDVSGPALAERLSTAKPALKVVYTCDSGSDANPESKNREIIFKPFKPLELLERISQYLDRD